MRSLRGLIVTAVGCIVAAWLSGATPAEACSCIGPIPACQGVWLSDAVFVGRVLDIANVEDEKAARGAFLRSRRVTLEVLEQFRGDGLLVARGGGPAVEVFTGQGSGDCGIAFKKGESYLVFATVSKGTPTVLQTGLCDRTRELSRAQDDLPYLRALATSPPRGGRVYGSVELADPQVVRSPPGFGQPERRPMADVPVALTEEGGSGVTKITSTGASGQYEFTDLAPGKYRVEASLPDSYYASGSTAPLYGELRDTRGCTQVNLWAAHDGRVSGRLLDARGKPVAGMSVTLLSADDVDTPYQLSWLTKAMTDGDGAYEVTKVPPGRFVAAINVERDFTTRELLQPRIFHPGVERSGDATPFDIGPGERVKLSDWSMPASRALVMLRGTVTTADGQPAPGVSVMLSIGDGVYERPVGGYTVTDAKGQFGLSVMEGKRFRLKADRRTTAPPSGDGTAGAGDANTRVINEHATSEPFVAAADIPWFTLRLEVRRQTP